MIEEQPGPELIQLDLPRIFSEVTNINESEGYLQDVIIYYRNLGVLVMVQPKDFLQLLQWYGRQSKPSTLIKFKKWFCQQHQKAKIQTNNLILYPLIMPCKLNSPQFMKIQIQAFYSQMEMFFNSTENKVKEPLRKFCFKSSQKDRLYKPKQQQILFKRQEVLIQIPAFFIQQQKSLNFLLAVQMPTLFSNELKQVRSIFEKNKKQISQVYHDFIQMYRQYDSILRVQCIDNLKMNETVKDYDPKKSAIIKNFDYYYFWDRVKKESNCEKQHQVTKQNISKSVEKGIGRVRIVIMPLKFVFGLNFHQNVLINVNLNYKIKKEKNQEQFKKILTTYLFTTLIHQISHFVIRDIRDIEQLQILSEDDNSFQHAILFHDYETKHPFGVKILQILKSYYWVTYNSDKQFFEKYKKEDFKKQQISGNRADVLQLVKKYEKVSSQYQKQFNNIVCFQKISNFLLYEKLVYYFISLLEFNQLDPLQMQKQSQGIKNSQLVQMDLNTHSETEIDRKLINIDCFFLLFTSEIPILLLKTFQKKQELRKKKQELIIQMNQVKKLLQKKQIILTENLIQISGFNQIFQDLSINKSQLYDFLNDQTVKKISTAQDLAKYSQQQILVFSNISKQCITKPINYPGLQIGDISRALLNFFNKINKKLTAPQSFQINCLINLIQLKQAIDINAKLKKFHTAITLFKELPKIFIIEENWSLQSGKYVQKRQFPNYIQLLYLKDYDNIHLRKDWKNIGLKPPQIQEAMKYLKTPAKSGGKESRSQLDLGNNYCYTFYKRFVEPFEKSKSSVTELE